MIYRFRTLPVDDRRSRYHLNIVVIMADDPRRTVNSRYSGHPGDGHLVSVIPRVRSNGVRRKFPNFSV